VQGSAFDAFIYLLSLSFADTVYPSTSLQIFIAWDLFLLFLLFYIGKPVSFLDRCATALQKKRKKKIKKKREKKYLEITEQAVRKL
jgi:hypothetical protein